MCFCGVAVERFDFCCVLPLQHVAADFLCGRKAAVVDREIVLNNAELADMGHARLPRVDGIHTAL